MASSDRFRGIRYLGIAAVLSAVLLSVFAGQSEASIDFKGKWGGAFSLPADAGVPREVDFSSNGDVFLASSFRIVRLDEDREPVAAWNPGGVADMAVDDDGNVYVGSVFTPVIRKYSNTGSVIGQWDIAGDPIKGVAFESGSIYIARGTTVERRSLDGTLLNQWSIQNENDFASPVIAGDDDGHVFVATTHLSGETATKTIQRFGPTGALLSTWTAPAEIEYETNPYNGYTYVSRINGYYGVAPAPDGGAFVRFSGADHSVNRLSSTGEPAGGWSGGAVGSASISVGPDGRVWAINWTNVPTFGEFEPDGTQIKLWGPDDLPKYNTGQLGEGKFSGIDDLSVAPDGKVLTLDSRNHRVQRFSSTGQFEELADVPAAVLDQALLVGALLVATTDGYAVLNSFTGQVVRYSADGSQIGSFPMNLAGKGLLDAVATPDGSYVMLAADGSSASVLRFDPGGQLTATWAAPANSTRIALTPAGDLLLLGPDRVLELTADGQELGCWGIDLPSAQTGNNPTRFPLDMATNDQGTVFVLIGGNSPALREYSSAGERTDDTPLTGLSEADAAYAAQVEAGPGDAVYVSGKQEISRYGWEPSGTPEPALECDPAAPFAIDSVVFKAKRRWARVSLSVPDAGTIEVAGGQKVKARSRNVGEGGAYRLAVIPKPRFMKPVRTKKRSKLRLSVRIRYVPAEGTAQELVRKMTFVRRVKHRAPHQKSR